MMLFTMHNLVLMTLSSDYFFLKSEGMEEKDEGRNTNTLKSQSEWREREVVYKSNWKQVTQ